MKRCTIGLLLLFSVTAGGEPSSEQIGEIRLREILGTRSIQKDTRHNGRLTMIDVPDEFRSKIYGEFIAVLNDLRARSTRDAVRVVAGLLDDDRYVREPDNNNTNTYTIAEAAEVVLFNIQRENPSVVPGAPSPAKAPDHGDRKAYEEWLNSSDRFQRAAWRRWWAENKQSYELAPPAARLPK